MALYAVEATRIVQQDITVWVEAKSSEEALEKAKHGKRLNVEVFDPDDVHAENFDRANVIRIGE